MRNLLLWLLLWPLAALAHQTGNSYLRIESSGGPLSLQVEFPAADVDALLQPGSAPAKQAPTRERLDQLQPQLAALVTSSIALEADGEPLALSFVSQRVVVRNDGLYLSQQHEAPPLPADAAQLTLRYGLFGEAGTLGRAFVKLQSSGRESSYVFDARHATQRLPLREISLAESLWTYAREGALHIWSGPDHLLFLLCLLLPGLSLALGHWRPLGVHALQVVSAFTLSHSLTLAAATLDWIVLPEKWVEAGIAATLVIAALLVLRSRETRHQWKLAFGFGLVHGLGFANGLRELGLATDRLAGSLLAFNAGVEFGQIVVVLVAGLLLWPLLRSTRAVEMAQRWGALLNLGLASAWLVERLA